MSGMFLALPGTPLCLHLYFVSHFLPFIYHEAVEDISLWFPNSVYLFFSSSSCFIQVLINIFSQHERRHVICCVVENRLSFGLCHIRGMNRRICETRNYLWQKHQTESGRDAQSFCKHTSSGGLSLRWSDPICLKLIGLIRAEERQWVPGTWVLCGCCYFFCSAPVSFRNGCQAVRAKVDRMVSVF